MSSLTASFAPGRLWSLWDIAMHKFEAARFCQLFANCMRLSDHIDREPGQLEPNREGFGNFLERVSALSGRYGLSESFDLVNRIRDDLATAPASKIQHDLQSIMGLMNSEMSKRLFFSVDANLSSYYTPPSAGVAIHHSKFGAKTEWAFPSAHMDMIEAGNCLALERNNGCVYHLMCVAEVGLRTLAWDRRVVAKHNKKAVPLEFAQWGELIGKLETEIDKIKSWRSKPTAALAQQFYNEALSEVRTFNNGWRTHIMHARSHTYTSDDAVALFGHVNRFMAGISKRVSENHRTALVWKIEKAA